MNRVELGKQVLENPVFVDAMKMLYDKLEQRELMANPADFVELQALNIARKQIAQLEININIIIQDAQDEIDILNAKLKKEDTNVKEFRR